MQKEKGNYNDWRIKLKWAIMFKIIKKIRNQGIKCGLRAHYFWWDYSVYNRGQATLKFLNIKAT